MMWRKVLHAAAVSVAVLGLSSYEAAADDAEAFYKQNKLITLTVGFGPGSGYDVWARLVARHMANHVPGAPKIIVKNQPGAGSLVAANHLYNVAPKDGTVIGTFSRNLPSQALIGQKGVRFDPRQFGWIGSPETSSRVCAVAAGDKVRAFKDVRAHEVLMGGMGPATAPSFVPRVLNELMGTKFKVIEGYHGAADINLAMQRGEVNGICQSYATVRNLNPEWIKSGKMVFLFNMETRRNPQIGGVPSIFEFVENAETRQVLQFMAANTELGYPFAAPPGVPAERLAALRAAFDRAVANETFRKEAERQKLDVQPTSGADLAAAVRGLYEIPDSVVKKAQSLMAAGGG